MCSTTPTKFDIDNSGAPESSTPKELNLSSARKQSHEQSNAAPALEDMVEALQSEIEEAMKELKDIWDEMSIENANLPTIVEEV
ncbi:hypothetical protein ACHAP5_005198 [Fusarium lateritium]